MILPNETPLKKLFFTPVLWLNEVICSTIEVVGHHSQQKNQQHLSVWIWDGYKGRLIDNFIFLCWMLRFVIQVDILVQQNYKERYDSTLSQPDTHNMKAHTLPIWLNNCWKRCPIPSHHCHNLDLIQHCQWQYRMWVERKSEYGWTFVQYYLILLCVQCEATIHGTLDLYPKCWVLFSYRSNKYYF